MLKTNKPEFLIIGVMKAGTTTLHHNLDQHEDISMSSYKEPGFLLPGYSKGIKEENKYLSLFDHSKLNGESTVAYLNSIDKVNLDKSQKIIVLLRDPVERLFSHFKMRHFLGEELSFDKFQTNNPDFKDIGFYKNDLEKLFKLIDKKNILILGFEEFIKEEELYTKKVLSFLNMKTENFNLRKQIQNESINYKNKSIIKIISIIEIYRIDIIPVINKVPLLRTFLRYCYSFIKNNFSIKLKMTDKEREDLVKLYLPHVKELKIFLNKNNFDSSFIEKWKNFN